MQVHKSLVGTASYVSYMTVSYFSYTIVSRVSCYLY